jgi:hypothetical protein
MYFLLPFFFKKYELDSTAKETISRLKSGTVEKDWKLNAKYFTRQLSHQVLEMELNDDSFRLSNTKYGLSFGRISLYPLLFGKLEQEPATGKTILKVTVRPSTSGLIIITVVFAFAIYLLITQLAENQLAASIPLLLFCMVIYLSIIVEFNKQVKNYKNVIEDHLM